MKHFFQLYIVFLETYCMVSSNRINKKIGIIALQNRRTSDYQSPVPQLSLSSSNDSEIKLLRNMSQPSRDQYKHLSPQVNNFHNMYYNNNPDIIPHKKFGTMSSVLKGLGMGQDDRQENDEAEHDQQSRLQHHSPHKGWGWSKPKKKHESHYHVSGGGGSPFSFLDLLLSGLSLISFGAFLMNLLGALLFSIFGSGYFTSTQTYPYYTTGTSTLLRPRPIRGSGIVNSISSYFRSGLKRKRKNYGTGTIQAEAGIGNIRKEEGTDALLQSSREEPDFDDEHVPEDVHEDDDLISSSMIRKRRTRRSIIWEPKINPYTSLDVAARNILHSIESMHSNYECMEKVVCDSNRHAKIIKNGLEYFMPIYTFSSSYFGKKLGLHANLSSHIRAIILGVLEDNCNTNFPQC